MRIAAFLLLALACGIGPATVDPCAIAVAEFDAEPIGAGTRVLTCDDGWTDAERGDGKATVTVTDRRNLDIDRVIHWKQAFDVTLRETDQGWRVTEREPQGDGSGEVWGASHLPPTSLLLRPASTATLPHVGRAAAVPAAWFAGATDPDGTDPSDRAVEAFVQPSPNPTAPCGAPLPGRRLDVLEITPEWLAFAGTRVATLDAGRPTDPGLPELVAALRAETDAIRRWDVVGKCRAALRLLVAADASVPASTVGSVLQAASEAGFEQSFLAVEADVLVDPPGRGDGGTVVQFGTTEAVTTLFASDSPTCVLPARRDVDGATVRGPLPAPSAERFATPNPHGELVSVIRMGSPAHTCDGRSAVRQAGTGGSFGPKGAGGVASAGGPVVVGSLDTSAIQSVIRRNLAQIRYCYQRELTRYPTLAGSVTVEFVITHDGTVSASNTIATTMNHPVVESCVSGRFSRFRFPEPPGGGVVHVTAPFVFSPG